VFQPKGSRLLVKRWPEVEERETGLLLPAAARELPQIGRVLAKGKGWWVKKAAQWVDMDINVGDDVVFEKFAKTDYRIYLGEDEFLLLPYSAIYLVINGGVNGINISCNLKEL
jgi:co-chaperonin GroES (HSP10)